MPTTVAIVTGASRGLGAALAEGLIGPDVHLLTVSRHPNHVLASLAARSNWQLQQIQADLSDPNAFEALVEPAIAALPLQADRYLLINNAGKVEPIGLAATLSDHQAISQAFTLNVSSVIALTSAFLRLTAGMKADRRIMNISSGAGRNPMPGWGVYCATKAALDMYTQVVHSENHGVRIASLAPGVIDTSMQGVIRSTDAKDFPNVERFLQLHEQGELPSATHTALAILNYLYSTDFGTTLLADIRDHQRNTP